VRGILLMAALVAAAVTSGAPEPVPPEMHAASELTTRQLAGQRIVCGFDGRTAPTSLLNAIANGEIGGVILFDDNIRSRRQVGRMSAAIQATQRPAPLRPPVLITIDQEGGQVKRLPGPPKFSAEEMGARGPKAARRQGAATGGSLRRAGINVDLAPVLDVARPRGFIADQGRGFSSKPGRVARSGVAFAEGLQRAGVAATAKHFPGLGSTATNTDQRPATIRLSGAKLRRIDEAPYARYIPAGGKLVMISSARYPGLGGGALPASQSRAIATDELRGRLGFEGVSITDSLEAPGATAGASPTAVATRAAAAGSDILLYVHCDAGVKAAATLRDGLDSGTLDRAEFERSVDRILALRATL